jgi:Kdo2-lipid IVA lauroyltransferase/acyltransferase
LGRTVTVLFRFFSVWPLWALHGLGAALGWVVFALSPTYRRHLLAHAALAGVSRADALASVAEAGKMVAELPRLWMGASVPVRMTGRGHIDAVQASGQGVLFFTPHMGCFEMTARAYAELCGQEPGKAMTVLFRPPRQAWLRQVVAGARLRPGLDTAPTTLAGVKQLVKALRSGAAVGLLPDQVPPEGQGVWAPFFGRPAYTMTLSARLAQTPRTTVLLAWGERLGWGRGYVVHVLPWGSDDPLPTDPVAACTAINAAMERLVLACPRQYLWGYARYKNPRGDAT